MSNTTIIFAWKPDIVFLSICFEPLSFYKKYEAVLGVLADLTGGEACCSSMEESLSSQSLSVVSFGDAMTSCPTSMSLSTLAYSGGVSGGGFSVIASVVDC